MTRATSSMPPGRARRTRRLAALAPTQVPVPQTPSGRASRGFPARAAAAAVAATPPRLPSCMTAHTGTWRTTGSPLTAAKTRRSASETPGRRASTAPAAKPAKPVAARVADPARRPAGARAAGIGIRTTAPSIALGRPRSGRGRLRLLEHAVRDVRGLRRRRHLHLLVDAEVGEVEGHRGGGALLVRDGLLVAQAPGPVLAVEPDVHVDVLVTELLDEGLEGGPVGDGPGLLDRPAQVDGGAVPRGLGAVELLLAHLLDLLGAGQQAEPGGRLVAGGPEVLEVGAGQVVHPSEVDGGPGGADAESGEVRAPEVEGGAVGHHLELAPAPRQLGRQRRPLPLEVDEALGGDGHGGAAGGHLGGRAHPGVAVVHRLGPGGGHEVERVGVVTTGDQ